MDITLTISKSAVMNEVAKQTSYIGLKITTASGQNGYDQVFMTNDDQEMAERYWREAVNATTGNLKKFVKSVSGIPTNPSVDNEEVFELELAMPTRYDESQTGTIQASMFSYFTNFITSKWLALTHKEETEYYDRYANASMSEILQKIYYKKPPKRT